MKWERRWDLNNIEISNIDHRPPTPSRPPHHRPPRRKQERKSERRETKTGELVIVVGKCFWQRLPSVLLILIMVSGAGCDLLNVDVLKAGVWSGLEAGLRRQGGTTPHHTPPLPPPSLQAVSSHSKPALDMVIFSVVLLSHHRARDRNNCHHYMEHYIAFTTSSH